MLNPQQISEFAVQAMWLVLLLSLPAVATAALVALAVAVAQTVTQIQDQSIGQSIRQIVVLVVVFVSAPWIASELSAFGGRLLTAIAQGRLT